MKVKSIKSINVNAKAKRKLHKTVNGKTAKRSTTKRKTTKRKGKGKRKSNKQRKITFKGGAQKLITPFEPYTRGEDITEEYLQKAIESVRECNIGDLTETETYKGTPLGLYILRDYLEYYDDLLERNREIEKLFLEYNSEVINQLTHEGYSYLLAEVDDRGRNLVMLASRQRLFFNIALKLIKTKQFDLGQTNNDGMSALDYLTEFIHETHVLILYHEMFKLFIHYYLEHDANNTAFTELVKEICSKRALKRIYQHEIECELFPVDSSQIEFANTFPPIAPVSPQHEVETETDAEASVASPVEPLEEGELIRDPREFNVSDPSEPGELMPKRRFP